MNTLKLGDFGVSTIMELNVTSALTAAAPGSLMYLAPELFEEPPLFGYKSDVWSLGCVLYEMCTLKPAVSWTFHSLSLNATILFISTLTQFACGSLLNTMMAITNCSISKPSIPVIYSDNVVSIIFSMLKTIRE